MRSDPVGPLVAAMVKYLQSSGVSKRELATYAEVSVEQLAEPETRLSPPQLQRLWQLIEARLLPSLSFSVQVRPLIAEQLARGRVRVEAVAEQLNMSRHTLYKKLKQENLTFAVLLEDLRRERALAYLQDRSKPLVEIAELLGFSELSAFSRAFKRWTGASPAKYRSSAELARAAQPSPATA